MSIVLGEHGEELIDDVHLQRGQAHVVLPPPFFTLEAKALRSAELSESRDFAGSKRGACSIGTSSIFRDCCWRGWSAEEAWRGRTSERGRVAIGGVPVGEFAVGYFLLK